MAGVLVDVLLERLATLALDKVERELKLVSGVKEEIENLTSNLQAIQAVLEDAEQRRVTEASVRRWLDELNQVSFEMDDVLDEWITEVQKHEMEKQGNQGEQSALLVTTTTKKKVCFPFPCCFSLGGQVSKLMLRRDIALRIEDLNKIIDLIDKEKQRFSFQNITRDPVLPERPKTTSLLGKTFGRDEEKNMILSKLFTEGTGGKGVPIIIPVVGMGGMGKTTLAQLVYNDERVKKHFECRMWVCVSDPFDVINIAKAIIEGLDKDNTSKNSSELQTLLQCIFELIDGKKILLVLDDVWYPKSNQWGELVKAFNECVPGSRILVTTRNMEVSKIMRAATNHIVHLTRLSEAYCSSLLYYSAGLNESESKNFHTVGRLIVEKCKGLPLAAKTLGSHMLGKTTIKQWQDVLESKIWEIQDFEQDVFRPLLLSYHDLVPTIKHCLLYCVVFPKDYKIKRDNLIELWSSQDYLNVKRNNTDLGNQYFDNLVMRSFFQEIEEGEEMYYKIHDIVHDFLQYLTKNECKIIDFEWGVGEKMEELNDKVRHLTLMHSHESESLDSLLKSKNLRTFAAFDTSISSSTLELIVKLKCLRTLNLSCSGIKRVPKEISELIHLRYLDLSENLELEELPDTMSSIYNLQTLRLVGCGILKKVDLRGLINLRHLHVDGCADPKLLGIEKITNLQTLDFFEVHDDGDGGNKVEDLKDLNQLQGSLRIWIWNVGDGYSGEKSIMVNKARLQHLTLEFYFGEFHREALDALQPHPGLESFRISGHYGGTTLTTDWWSSLSNLRSLHIEGCENCEFLPPLGKLASLESLTIQSLENVTKVGVEFLGIIDPSEMQTSTLFPKLKQLTFFDMESWESWEGEEETSTTTIMPCLSELTFWDCPSLEQLPDFLWKAPLQTVNFNWSPSILEEYGEKLQDMKMEKNSNDSGKFKFHATNK